MKATKIKVKKNFFKKKKREKRRKKKKRERKDINGMGKNTIIANIQLDLYEHIHNVSMVVDCFIRSVRFYYCFCNSFFFW